MFRNLVSSFLVMFLLVGSILAEEFKVSKPFIQLGHTKNISVIAITPDGKYILSGSIDKTLKLWEISTGMLIRTFSGHTEEILSIAITPDGNYVVSGSKDKTSKLWDLKTGQNIRTVTLSESVSSFSQNAINSVNITPDGKFVISGDYDGNEVIWDIKTGKKMPSLHLFQTQDIALSKNGKYIFSVTRSGNFTRNELGKSNELRFEGDFEHIRDIDVSNDNRYVITSGSNETLTLWDAKSAKKVREFNGHSGNVYSVAITPNSKYIVSASTDRTLRLWDINSAKEIRTFGGQDSFVSAIAITPDSKYIVSGGGDNTLRLWDINTGKEVRHFKGNLNKVDHISISSDSTLVFNHYSNKNLNIWDMKTKKEVRRVKDPTESHLINALSITPDGKHVLSTGFDESVLRMWDIKTREVIKTFGGIFSGHSGNIEKIAISLDGTFAVSAGSSDKKVIKWDITSSDEINKIELLNPTTVLAITHDGKQVVTDWTYFDKFTFIELDTGEKVKHINKDSKEVYNVFSLTPDGKYYFTIKGLYLKLFDIKTDKEVKSFKSEIKNVISLGITPDSKYVVTGGLDGTVKYYDIKTGKEILTIVSFKDGEWLSITPEGYFNASKNGAKHLNILTGPMQVSSIDQYYETFYRPGIVASVMSGKVDKYAKTTLKLSDVKPAPQVAIIDTKTSVKKEELKVTLKITPSSGGIGQIRLYLDGVLIKTDGDRGLQKKDSKNSVLKTYTIKLPKGKHTIKAIVYNEANTMASRKNTLAVVSTYNPIVKPNIYAVVVGINEYKNPTIALKYAVADAELFAKTIKKRTKGLYGDVKIELLTTKKQTSKENITKTLKKMEKISPNDLFIFFVASHGMIEDAKYHMITSNVGALSSRGIKREAISQNSLRDMIANIPTTKKFIILDTCNSGALGEAIEVALLTRGLTETTAMKVLSRAVGSTIISASSSSQEALEGYKGHGLLTYVLTDGLNGKADSDRDGYIKTLEIANFVEDMVPEIAEKEFKRAQYPFVSPLGQGFPLVKVK